MSSGKISGLVTPGIIALRRARLSAQPIGQSKKDAGPLIKRAQTLGRPAEAALSAGPTPASNRALQTARPVAPRTAASPRR
jgi:hypothetical protein